MSAKNLDGKGRFRSKTIAFRVSPEEDEQLNISVALSGLTKQDYIISKVSNRDVIVMPSSRIFKALKDQLAAVLAELKKNENGEIDSEMLETIRLINTTLYGIKGGDDNV